MAKYSLSQTYNLDLLLRISGIRKRLPSFKKINLYLLFPEIAYILKAANSRLAGTGKRKIQNRVQTARELDFASKFNFRLGKFL